MTPKRYLLSILAVALLLAGCGPARPSATPSPPAATTPPTATAVPPTATATEPPPTATWVPTLPPPSTATPTAPPALSEGDLAVMDRIEDEVEDLRGLDELEPITRTLMTQEELAAHMERQFTEEYSPAEIEADVRTLAAFDFVPEDFDLLGLLLDLYSSQVLGLYDDEEDTFYVLSEGKFDLQDQITFAHEYTHGLQDEHFNLEAFIDDEVQNDDEVLARMALVEGDASLSMTEWLLNQLSRLSQADLAALFEEENDQAALEAAPPIIRETFIFPYVQGQEFVTLLQENGWQAVDAAFGDPPQSTEQILHPEKYFDRDPPTVVALPPLTDTLGGGWRFVEADTLGEFQTALYLENYGDEEAAVQAAEGWDGDQYALYVQGDDEILVFATVWDTPVDREEFVAAYTQYAEAKYGGAATKTNESERWWQTPSQTTVLAWDETAVWIVVGPDPETVEKVLAAIQVRALEVRCTFRGALHLRTDVADWPYSNYPEWVGEREFVGAHFGSVGEYRAFVEEYLTRRRLPEELAEQLRDWEE